MTLWRRSPARRDCRCRYRFFRSEPIQVATVLESSPCELFPAQPDEVVSSCRRVGFQWKQDVVSHGLKPMLRNSLRLEVSATEYDRRLTSRPVRKFHVVQTRLGHSNSPLPATRTVHNGRESAASTDNRPPEKGQVAGLRCQPHNVTPYRTLSL